MTIKKLEQSVTIGKRLSYETYEIEIIYRGLFYKCVTCNTFAVYAIKYNDDWYYTRKEALLTLYKECKEKNNLI